MIHIGTSGYSYDDWVGPFYPHGLPKNQFLDFYAEHFGCVEVNFTYYRMPNARTLQAMSRKTGPKFRFVVKAPGEVTHERSGVPEACDLFRTALQPLIQDGKFGGILAQFPWSFKPTPENRTFLSEFRAQLLGLPVVVEFRHAAWINSETFEFLRRNDLGFCCVDEPPLRTLMPPIAERTSEIGYVRFHGRNAAKWFGHEHAWERYNYLYSRQELEDWVVKTRKLAEGAQDVYVFFNNHYNAQAVQNASLFAEMLREGGN